MLRAIVAGQSSRAKKNSCPFPFTETCRLAAPAETQLEVECNAMIPQSDKVRGLVEKGELSSCIRVRGPAGGPEVFHNGRSHQSLSPAKGHGLLVVDDSTKMASPVDYDECQLSRDGISGPYRLYFVGVAEGAAGGWVGLSLEMDDGWRSDCRCARRGEI
jgi:hypothetical protein